MLKVDRQESAGDCRSGPISAIALDHDVAEHLGPTASTRSWADGATQELADTTPLAPSLTCVLLSPPSHVLVLSGVLHRDSARYAVRQQSTRVSLLHRR